MDTTTENTPKGKEEDSSYLDARRKWNERYGEYVASAKTWKTVAFISLFIVLLSTGGTIYLALQKRVIPYYVEHDSKGKILKVQRAASPGPETMQRITTSQLADFVGKVRNVVIDAKMQRQNILDAYVFLQRNTPAYTKVSQFFRDNHPFERAKKETVFAEITNILPLKDNAYEIEWNETVMNRKNGQTKTKFSYKLIAYTTLSPPTDGKSIINNPIGLVINDLNWSKEL